VVPETHRPTEESEEPVNVIETLRKLLAHQKSAESIGSEAEAAAFADKVQDLLTKHHLEIEDIEVGDETEDVAEDHIYFERVGLPRRRSGWFERLALAVARNHFCDIAIWPGGGAFTLIGKRADREVAGFMIVYLARVARHLCKRDLMTLLRSRPRTRRTAWRQSFLHAFALEIAIRYYLLRQRAGSVYGSEALVKIEAAESLVKRYVDARFHQRTKQLSRPGGFSQSGAARGRFHASQVSLKPAALSAADAQLRLLKS
jgi:hypothetical protein